MYDGRSMKKTLREIESFGGQSNIIKALCSIKLRFADYKASPSELKEYDRSKDPLVLSSFVYYLSKNAAKDKFAHELLVKTAKETVNPSIRAMATYALNATALD